MLALFGMEENSCVMTGDHCSPKSQNTCCDSDKGVVCNIDGYCLAYAASEVDRDLDDIDANYGCMGDGGACYQNSDCCSNNCLPNYSTSSVC